jgi:hypothetical protein
MARDRAALAEAPRNWPAARLADARDHQRHLLCQRAGYPWRLLPNDLPTWGRIYRWFAAWRDDGRFQRINHALVMADRERVGRDASRRQSSTVRVPRPPRPAGHAVAMPERKINGRKRHALVDTDGRGLVLERSRSCARTPIRSASPLTRGVGSSTGSSRGSGAIDGWQKTSRLPSTPHAPSIRRIRHAARATDRSSFMTFETDSKVNNSLTTDRTVPTCNGSEQSQ